MALRVAGSSPVIHPRLPPLCGGKRRKPQSEPLRLPAFCPFRVAAAFFFGHPAKRRGGFFHPWLLSEVRLSRLSGRLRGRDGSLVRRAPANRFGNGRTGPTAEGIKQTSALNKYRGVAQLVARLLWEQDAAGSNPVTPTSRSVLTALKSSYCFENGSSLMLLLFSFA